MKTASQLRMQAFAAAAVALLAATVLTLDGDGEARVAGRLGPTPGPNSAGHVEAKRSYLDRIARAEPGREAAGLVSFTRLLPATEVEPMVADMDATVVFVMLPEGEPEAIALTRPLRETVAARAEEVADDVRAEIVSLEAELARAPEAEREELDAALERRRLALDALRADCACVYALGVEGATLAELAALQGREEVLLVDVPDPVATDLSGWQLTPILPASAAS